jgi:hypothetical protein
MTRISIAGVGILSLLLPQTASGQSKTDKPCRILFENLSREVFTIKQVSIVGADGQTKEYNIPWTFEPGNRSPLTILFFALEGCNITYTIELPDGAKGRHTSTISQPLVLDHDYLLQSWTDSDFAKLRKNDANRKLSKAEATYRYWNSIHDLYMKVNLKARRDMGYFNQASIIARATKDMIDQIEGLDENGVDEDAIALVKNLVAVSRAQLDELASRDLSKTAVWLKLGKLFRAMYQSDIISLAEISAEVDDENKKTGDINMEMIKAIGARRRVLEKRYHCRFPFLFEQISTDFTSFTFSRGYYLKIKNISEYDLRNIRIRYRSANGEIRYQDVNRILKPGWTGDHSNDWLEIDPTEVKWEINADQWITISYEGGVHTFPVSDIIKK